MKVIYYIKDNKVQFGYPTSEYLSGGDLYYMIGAEMIHESEVYPTPTEANNALKEIKGR
jgi:hypothetical protein